MMRGLEVFLFGAALLQPLRASAAPSASSAPQGAGLHAGVARAIGGMAGSPPGQSWDPFRDMISALNQLMPVRGPEGLEIPREALERSPAVLGAADPIAAALREDYPDIGDSPIWEQVAAVLPRAGEIVAERAQALEAALDGADLGDLKRIREQADLAYVLFAYNLPYVPGQKSRLRSLHIDWGVKQILARKRRGDAAGAQVEEEIAGTAASWSSPGLGATSHPALVTARYVSESGTGLLAPTGSLSPRESARRNQAAHRRLTDAAAAEEREFFRLDHENMAASGYPLSGTRTIFDPSLRAALDAGDPVAFWGHVRSAFDDLELRMDRVFAWLPRRAVEPALRIRIVQNLTRQAEALRDRVLELYNERSAATGDYKLGRRGDRRDPAAERFMALLAKIRGADLEHLSEEILDNVGRRNMRAAYALVAFVDTLRDWLRLAPARFRGRLRRFMEKGSDSPRVLALRALDTARAFLGGAGGPARTLLNRALLAAAGGLAAWTAAAAALRSIGVLYSPGLFLMAIAVLGGLGGFIYSAIQLRRLSRFRAAAHWIKRNTVPPPRRR